MREAILQKLHEIAQSENIAILHAVESGSRAWGFPSPDSDYDVRFFYLRRTADYLRLDRRRDVLEYAEAGDLDINGWDLDKTLRLLHDSNPTLFEWSTSPIVYMTTDFFRSLLPTINTYFVKRSSLWHYLGMAEHNYRDYLKGALVKAKKYFYVIRPLLACHWILDRGTPPPMLFSELIATQLEPEFRPALNELLTLKAATAEIGEIPRIDILNYYIEKNLVLMREQIATLPKEPEKSWADLNEIFRDLLLCPQKLG
jgi:predicted nucleotidyltransferase